MPYDGQQAGKRGHSDFIKNPDVQAFLAECEYLKTPGREVAERIAATYVEAPKRDELPSLVVASDASPYANSIDDKFPSTQVGYVKVSLMAFDMADYNGLQRPDSPFVDPFAAAELHNRGRAVAFTLPGSNVKYKNLGVQDGFRLAVYEQFSHDRTRFRDGLSITELLFRLEDGQIEVKKCPCCGEEVGFCFTPKEDVSRCPKCDAEVYVTDDLRIHEQISDHGDNKSAITRFMNAAEHLLLANFVNTLAAKNLDVLCGTVVMLDGPLALFGQPAKYHASLQRFYNSVFKRCLDRGKTPPLILGLQKEGQVMEHARSIAPYLRNGTYRPITDDYRAEFINGLAPQTDNFGHETYYGQDFIYKTDSGRVFDVCLAYPFADKQDRKAFAKKKGEVEHYEPWVARAFALLRHLECDLYENATVPTVLAHRHASISLKPGGTLLDVLTKKHLGA
ncbi:MAG TPA: hypothetical protein VNO84_07740 [Burkholderiaceae bacterium]|nr:hypothetical protein [Burkholderiaceae bacterium]